MQKNKASQPKGGSLNEVRSVDRVKRAKDAIATAAQLANEEGAALLYRDLHEADKTLCDLEVSARVLAVNLADAEGNLKKSQAENERLRGVISDLWWNAVPGAEQEGLDSLLAQPQDREKE